jgi:hypothetical protein
MSPHKHAAVQERWVITGTQECRGATGGTGSWHSTVDGTWRYAGVYPLRTGQAATDAAVLLHPNISAKCNHPHTYLHVDDAGHGT